MRGGVVDEALEREAGAERGAKDVVEAADELSGGARVARGYRLDSRARQGAGKAAPEAWTESETPPGTQERRLVAFVPVERGPARVPRPTTRLVSGAVHGDVTAR